MQEKINYLQKVITHAKEIRENIFRHEHNWFELTFQITAECNLRCSYCYETKQGKKVSLESAKKVIDKLFSINDNKAWWNNYIEPNSSKDDITFNFFGGECFLEIDNMEILCSYFIEKCKQNMSLYQKRIDNFKIICQSNGTLLQTDKVKAFLKKWEKNLIMFITIDGSREMHDKCRLFKDTKKPTWQLVHDNIIWYKDTYGKMPYTKGTIDPTTIQYLYKSYIAYKEMGFKDIKITLREDCEWPEAAIKEAEKQYKMIMEDLLKYSNSEYKFSAFNKVCYADLTVGNCGIFGDALCLSIDDKLYNCFNYTPLSIPNREPYYIGDVEHGITKTDRVEKLKNWINTKKYMDEKCNSCQLINTCADCPATSYKQCGEIDKMVFHSCQVTKIEQKYAILYNYLKEQKYGKETNKN